jgi:regulator of sirC expression with transglutaminase-like and TPR domain
MRELTELLAGGAEGGTLDVAAAQIARIEFSELSEQSVVGELDAIAAAIAERGFTGGGPGFVRSANAYLFSEMGFTGNDFDYYDARNSCLNEVLRRRLGIPITLAVVYMEVARRLGQPVYGIGLPGHFVAQFDDGEYSTYIDVFDKGRLLTAKECEDMIRIRAGAPIENRIAAFRRATKRQILSRMLQNLKGVYMRNEQWPKALAVLNLLVDAYPNAPEELRLRGVVNLKSKLFRAARADLLRYLDLAPNASDAAQIREQIQNLDRWAAQWN